MAMRNFYRWLVLTLHFINAENSGMVLNAGIYFRFDRKFRLKNQLKVRQVVDRILKLILLF